MILIRHNYLLFLLLFVLLLSEFTPGQVVFRELPGYKPNLKDHSFFEITQTRKGSGRYIPQMKTVRKRLQSIFPPFLKGKANLSLKGVLT